MARIPQNFIDDLLTRTDIVPLIDARVPLKKAGREYQACCPFHNEKTPSFTVSPNKQFYHCFGCGAHGTALSFLIEYDRLEFLDAVQTLADAAGVEVPRDNKPDEEQRESGRKLYDLMDNAARRYQAALKSSPRAIEYLKNRGIDGQIARDFGIGYAPEGWGFLTDKSKTSENDLLTTGMAIRKEGGDSIYDRFRDRIMFPIRDSRGRVIAFGGRVLDQGEPKYLNSPETPLFHKGRQLYGLYEARQAQRDLPRLLVVEGYMDVVALAQFGLRYAVATLGTATTEDHLALMFRSTKEIVFCFDGDKAGRRAATRALERAMAEMRDGRSMRFLFLPEGEDPDSLIRKEGQAAFEQRLKTATPLSQYLIDVLTETADLDSPEGRAALVAAAKPWLAPLADGAFRDLLMAELGKLSGMTVGELSRHLQGQPVAAKPVSRPAEVKLNSPVRRALALLLEKPALAAIVNDLDRLRDAPFKGAGLFVDVLEFFQQQPQATAAILMQAWQGRPEAVHLARLAAQPLPLEAVDMDKEFAATLELLNRRDETSSLSQKVSQADAVRDDPESLKQMLEDIRRTKPPA